LLQISATLFEVIILNDPIRAHAGTTRLRIIAIPTDTEDECYCICKLANGATAAYKAKTSELSKQAENSFTIRVQKSMLMHAKSLCEQYNELNRIYNWHSEE